MSVNILSNGDTLLLVGRLKFCSLKEPSDIPGFQSEKKYRMTLIVPKTNQISKLFWDSETKQQAFVKIDQYAIAETLAQFGNNCSISDGDESEFEQDANAWIFKANKSLMTKGNSSKNISPKPLTPPVLQFLSGDTCHAGDVQFRDRIAEEFFGGQNVKAIVKGFVDYGKYNFSIDVIKNLGGGIPFEGGDPSTLLSAVNIDLETLNWNNDTALIPKSQEQQALSAPAAPPQLPPPPPQMGAKLPPMPPAIPSK